MSRVQQDQFIEDDDEVLCPLCVEELDLTDQNFRPCPCGYQICQFCFNNIRTTMNGLCPACRRPYDERTISFKVVSAEEMAKHKADAAAKAKKNAALKQKEAQKREADSLSRKHLAGLRVVQKNLVYVTGLSPTIREDRLLETLRGEEYFGQYGKIVKIVVSKSKDTSHHPQSVGVYVTFARKQDAASCIAAVDGSQNGERVLRAQYGTTKYCSAYLRNETCNNRNCMFLHEPGEESESFSRQDLSSMNVLSTQQPTPALPTPSSQRAPQPIAAATQPMNRQESSDAPASPAVSNPDASALPSTASWGNKAAQAQQGRRTSRPTSSNAAPSPIVSKASPLSQLSTLSKPEPEPEPTPSQTEPTDNSPAAEPTPDDTEAAPSPAPERQEIPHLDGLLKAIASSDFNLIFSASSMKPDDWEIINNFPLLVDPHGGAKRRARKEKERQRSQTVEGQPAETEDNAEGGSLQLGGEPEEREDSSLTRNQLHVIAPPSQQSASNSAFGVGSALSLTDDLANLNIRGNTLTPHHQQQLLLQQFKPGNPGNPQSAGGLGAGFQGGQAQNPQSTSLGLGQQSASGAQGHARHTSRFSFASDNASASAAVKPVANPKLMNQQASMMPQNSGHFNQVSQHQTIGNQYYTSGVQGPPPGLKTTGTPPVSGGGMFSHGQGFATGGLNYVANAASRNANDEMIRELLRGRGSNASSNQVSDAGKHDRFPGSSELSLHEISLIRGSMPSTPSLLEHSRRSTPTIPPGFTFPSHMLPTSDGLARPAAITPAVPLFPPGLSRASTPMKDESIIRETDNMDQTPFEEKQLSTPTSVKPEIKGNNLYKSEASLRSQIKTPPPVEQRLHETATGSTRSKKEAKGKNVVESRVSDGSPISRKSAKKKVAADKPSHQEEGSYDDTASEIAQAVEPLSSKASKKRQPPGKLDIESATDNKPPSTTTGKAELDDSHSVISSINSAHAHTTGVSSATGSPIKRAGPRTIRVLPTPKTETTAMSASSVTSAIAQAQVLSKLPSRKTSIASINMPSTPVSELVSDNASVTSAPLSRASSPPLLNKQGSVASRKKPKNQAKKERQERAKQIVEEKPSDGVPPTPTEEPLIQAPIVSRKKKAKKTTNATTTVSPAIPTSNPNSPRKNELPVEATPPEVPNDPPPPVIKPPPPKVENHPESPDAKTLEIPPPSAHSAKPSPTAASVLSDLQMNGDLITSALEFFKPIAALNHRADSSTAGSAAHDYQISLTQEHVNMLQQHLPVRVGGDDGRLSSRALLTPGWKFLRGLSEEQEEKYLAMEKLMNEASGPGRYRHRGSKRSNDSDILPRFANALKEATGKLKQRQDYQPVQPVGDGVYPTSQGEDDALQYLNQFVVSTEPPYARGPTISIGGATHPPKSHSYGDTSCSSTAAGLETLAVGLETLAGLLGELHNQGLEGTASPNGGLNFTAVHETKDSTGRGSISVEEAERDMLDSRKETEKLEKMVNLLIKRNKKIAIGAAGGN